MHPGDLAGELAIFSNQHKRAAAAVCSLVKSDIIPAGTNILGPVLVKAENLGYYCAKKFNDRFLILELTDDQDVIHEISI